MPSPRLIAVALLALYGAASVSLGARAEPLDRDECKTLKEKEKTALTKEVSAALARGPDWVKDHLHSPGDIEKVRQYLEIEAKVEFRCRTDGVVVPKPEPVPLPDRKPQLPLTVVAGDKPEQTKVLAGAASTSLLPLRKPTSSSEQVGAGNAAGDGDRKMADGETTKSASAVDGDTGPSQTVADSDKTAPPKTKATQ
jgi:hypothetical protein